MLDGSFGTTTFQVGASANETISVKMNEMSSKSLEATRFEGSTSVTAGTGSGAIAVTVKGAGGTDKTYSVMVKDGSDQDEIDQAVTTMLNDANIGVSAYVKDGGGINMLSVASGGATTAGTAGVNIQVGALQLLPVLRLKHRLKQLLKALA